MCRGNDNVNAIVGLVAEMKRCDVNGITIASIAMAYVCIDTLAGLSRPAGKTKSTRSDFILWVERYLQEHPDQPYSYRGKDVYAARCALLHTYGSEVELHKNDTDLIKFAYHDGGKHRYDPLVSPSLAIIGVKSFVDDVVRAVDSFLEECQTDEELRKRLGGRLPDMIRTRSIKP